jgi:hypothetical protein
MHFMAVHYLVRVLGFVFLASAALLPTAQCEVQRRPYHYLIPRGYVGWFQIHHGRSDSPGLPIEDGSYILKIPASGELYTSTAFETGWAKDRCYYYSGSDQQGIEWGNWGHGGLIWGGIITYGDTETTLSYFVGSQAVYQQHMLDDPRKIGPIE